MDSMLLDGPPFGLQQRDKEVLMLAELRALQQLHLDGCREYRAMIDAVWPEATGDAADLQALPWLPARLFKLLTLSSVPGERIVRRLVSSGTGGAPSQVVLDAPTAALQSRALARIVGDFIGKQRRPMVIIDDDGFLQNRARVNARGAAILGFSLFAREQTFLLDSQLRPDWSRLERVLAATEGPPPLLFGFTFLVWESFVRAAQRDGVRLRMPPGTVLVHGGGWKRLADRQVSREQFNEALARTFGIEQVHNYYGMVEQVGAIFFECEAGYLHAPAYADVIVRDPTTFAPLPSGQAGLLQLLSVIPRSYPGHSILSEDLGTVVGEDDCPCGRLGRRFHVHGRLPATELRGCSDTRSLPA
jgi:phenylacetate-coenzyme A ligase PaaK-like adenylate-forming protein